MLKISTKFIAAYCKTAVMGWRLTIMPWTGFVKSTTINKMERNKTFGDAIEALKNGKRVQREGWNGKGLFVL